MKIKSLILLVFCCASVNLLAQQTTEEKLYRIDQLQQGFFTKFVYKKQVIDSPFALQIPLLEANDPEVSYEFNKFKQQRKWMNWISRVGLGLTIYSWIKPGQVTDEIRYATIGATTLVNIYVGLVSMQHFERALTKYNSLTGEAPQLSFELKTSGAQGTTMGLNWKYNF